MTTEREDGVRVQDAANVLYAHWMDGTVLDRLPEALRPTTRGQGYAIQATLEQRGIGPLFGWKIAATSAAGQAHINVDGPLAGRLMAGRVVPEGVPVRLGANRMRVAEIEFAFRMGATLPPREESYGAAEVMAAVEALHLAIEVPDSRFADFCAVGAAQLIADNACASQFVLGLEAPAAWRDADLSTHRVVGRVGGRHRHEGSGGNVLGDPRVALAWLATELSRDGIPLGVRQVVTTGTCVVPLPIAPGDTVVGDFGALGQVSVSCAA